MKKHWKILLCILCISIICGTVVYGETNKYIFEVGVPGIAGAGTSREVNDFGSLVLSVIRLSYRLAFLFAFYKLVESGYKYMMSKGSDSKVKDAVKAMKNILIGLLILLGVYIILNFINPELTRIPKDLSKLEVNTLDKVEDLKIDSSGESFFAKADITVIGEDDEEREVAFDGNFNDVAKSDWAKLLVSNLEGWRPPNNCGKIVLGPMQTGHIKTGSYESCHDYNMAMDIVVYDTDGKTSQECTELLMKWLNGMMGSKTQFCNEFNCSDNSQDHYHLNDSINCIKKIKPLPCRTDCDKSFK